MNMMTRRLRTAQAAATGQSEPHTSIPASVRRQTRAPKGHGAPQAAAVGSMPGIPDVDHTTAQPNQVVLYEDVEADQGLPESQNLRISNVFKYVRNTPVVARKPLARFIYI